MRAALRSAALAALALGLAAPEGAEAATVFRLDLLRTSPDEEARTFEGFGTLEIEAGAASPADVLAFELDVYALGSAAGDGSPVTWFFRYGADEIEAVSGFESLRPLSGVLLLESRATAGGEVVLDGLRLDFARGLAEGFCFAASEGSPSCIRGGGSSSGVEAELRVAPIPLPASLPLAAAGLALLGLLRARRAPRLRPALAPPHARG